MRFTLYAEKSVSECVKALNERIDAKKNSKQGVRGKADKNGDFSLWISTKVIFIFKRTTTMNAKIRRESGNTLIEGFVPDGMSPYWMGIAGLFLVGVCAGFLLIGETVLAVLGALIGAISYVILRGDYRNSDLLLLEVERTLKASPKPPKKKS